jgi:hypothetical protein
MRWTRRLSPRDFVAFPIRRFAAVGSDTVGYGGTAAWAFCVSNARSSSSPLARKSPIPSLLRAWALR